MDEEEEEEEDITTTMQSLTAMQQSCTCPQGICFFPVNKEEKEKKEEREEEMEEENTEEDEEITTAMQLPKPKNIYFVLLHTWCLNARSSDDASAKTEKDMESRQKSWEGLVWYP